MRLARNSAARVFVVAVLARWLFCFFLFPRFLAERSTVGEQYYLDSYREIAAAIWAGDGYSLGPGGPPALHRPPGYVAFLALCTPWDTARCHVWLHLLQGLLGGCAALFTIRAASAWGIAPAGALFAGWIVALWPFAVWEAKVTVPENLLLALVPAGLRALAHARRIRWAILTGLIGAAMALTHPIYLVILLPFLAGIAWMPIDRLRKVGSISLMLAIFCLPIGLWVMRNHRLGYDGISTGFGYNYFRGVYAFDVLLDGRPYFRDHDGPAYAFVNERLRRAGLEPYDSNLRRSHPALNASLDRLAILHLEAHLVYSAIKVVVKAPLAWVQQQTPVRSAVTAALLVPLFILVPAPACGRRRRERLGAVFLTVLVVNAAFAAVAVEAIPMRYMLPLVSPLAMLAGAGLSTRIQPTPLLAPASSAQLDSSVWRR